MIACLHYPMNVLEALLNKKWFLVFGFLTSFIFYFAMVEGILLFSIPPEVNLLFIYITVFGLSTIIGFLSPLDTSKPVWWYGFLLGIYQFFIILIIIFIRVRILNIWGDIAFAYGATFVFSLICFFPMNSIGLYIGFRVKHKRIET